MAAKTRFFGWDLALLTLTDGSTHTLTAIYQNCQLTLDFETDQSRATRDTVDGSIKGFDILVQKARGWTVTLGNVVDSSVASDHLMVLALTGGSRSATNAAGAGPAGSEDLGFRVNLFRPGSGMTSGQAGYSYRGTAIFTEASLEYPDGAALQGATLTGVGALVATGTT